jgi:hypothetical protein
MEIWQATNIFEIILRNLVWNILRLFQQVYFFVKQAMLHNVQR